MLYFVKWKNSNKICLKVEKITYLFIYVRQQGCNTYYIVLASLDLVWSHSIPRYARDALGPNKVLGSLGNVIFPPIFIASLLPPCNEEINS